ncbi:MAG: ThuA domain-containing protein [Planctomycetes bacterium]|nr:ThuA domain-containing protein [Planctomycetota bacterium]
MSCRKLLITMLVLSIPSACAAQFPWQKPVQRSKEAVAKILGPVTQREPSRDLTIVWVWGVDKLHEKGTHEYAWVMDDYVNTLLPHVPRVTAIGSMYFPKKELWEKADLVVFYMWPREQWDYDLIDAYQNRGGGLIFIHMALMQGSGEELAGCIGKAWDHRNGATKWGVLPTPVTLTDAALQSPIFKGFPKKFDLADEFYWGLRGDPAGITALMTSPAGPAIANKPLDAPPKVADLDGKDWPVMWTKQVGRGKVFVTGAGHNYFTFNDPYFRIILLRAMAWTMNESFDPFKPLVTQDIKSIH